AAQFAASNLVLDGQVLCPGQSIDGLLPNVQRQEMRS
ncbi:MAG: hypothetical protein ACI932_002685, partial [Paracoccaceae bacterium]